ncbi:MAG: restriction endonuclease subunit S [Vibrio sp.]
MSDFEQELAQISEESIGEAEEKLPTLEEQQAIVAKLKQLEEKGELTPEILEHYFGKFSTDADAPVH